MRLHIVQNFLILLVAVNFYMSMQAAENELNVNSVKGQIIGVLQESPDFKEIAPLYNYDTRSLLSYYMKSTYDDDHDDVGAEVDKIHAQVLEYHINQPLQEILLQVLEHKDKAIILQQGRYELIGGFQTDNSYEHDILNFVAQHPNYYFDIAPVVAKILDEHHYKASVIDFINRHIKIIPQTIPNLQNRLLKKSLYSDSRLIQQCLSNMPEALSSVQFLINLGADVNDKNISGQTALMVACHNRSIDSCKLVTLLGECGADVNASSGQGLTPLIYACAQGSLDKVRYLLSKKAQVNSISKAHWTPLFKACEYKSADTFDIIELLVDHGADINDQRLFDGWTPLMFACRQGSLEAVRSLLHKGAQVNCVSKSHDTALMKACENRSENSLPIMELLIDHGVDVNAQKSDGMTSLMIACHQGSVEKVQYLLSKGAQVNGKSKTHNTPLMYTCNHQMSDCSDDSGDVSKVVELVNLLVEAGAEVETYNDIGQNVLMHACHLDSEHSLDLVMFLVKKGANIDHIDHQGYSSLMYALSNERIVKFLLDQGVNVDHQDAQEKTALMHALDMVASQTGLHTAYVDNAMNVVELLLSSGADINHQDISGSTALMVVCQSSSSPQSVDLVRYLLDQGADRNLTNLDGRKAIDYAGTEEVRELLRSYRVS